MKAHEGYLMIDHRASPGTIQVPEGTRFEAATLHCAHCNCISIKNPGRTRERASCPLCDYLYICDNCYLETRQMDYVHKPHKQRIEDLHRKFSNG